MSMPGNGRGGGGDGDGGRDGDGRDLEDLLLWKSFTRDVESWKDPDWEAEENEARERSRSQGQQAPSPLDGGGERTVRPDVGGVASRSVPDPDPQLDRRTDARLRKGKIPIEARLDLHGMTQDQARSALERFITDSVAQGRRCVLVITGKGTFRLTGEGGGEGDWTAPVRGVLKRRVPEWLAGRPLSDVVLKVYPARVQDGGEGALYVYLKRMKD